ncbi:hypothetical protein D3C59_36735, partial [Streptomyces sp. SHP22-7]
MNATMSEQEDAEQTDTVAVYSIEAGTPTRRLSTIEAQDAALMHFRRGDALHEYDTTDRNDAPCTSSSPPPADQ